MISKISLSGYCFGTLVAFMSIWQWFIRYTDLSQLIIFLFASCVIIAFSYVYNWMRRADEKILSIQRQADNIGAHITNNKEEADREGMFSQEYFDGKKVNAY